MSYAFIDHPRGAAPDLMRWALPLAMLLLPLGGMLLLLASGVLFGEGFVTPELPTPSEPTPEPLPDRRK